MDFFSFCEEHVGGRTLTMNLKSKSLGVMRKGMEKAYKEESQSSKQGLLSEEDEASASCTYSEDDDMKPFDLGGQWVFPSQAHIIALLDRLGIQTEARHAEEMRVAIDLDVFDPNEFESEGSSNHIGIRGLQPYKGPFPKLTGVFDVMEMSRFIRKAGYSFIKNASHINSSILTHQKSKFPCIRWRDYVNLLLQVKSMMKP